MSHSGDRLVDPKAILEALSQLKRPRQQNRDGGVGVDRAGAGRACHGGIELRLSEPVPNRSENQTVPRPVRQIESLVLVSILALRNAQLRLWEDDREDRPPSPPSDEPTA